jgi:hypothetical protein
MGTSKVPLGLTLLQNVPFWGVEAAQLVYIVSDCGLYDRAIEVRSPAEEDFSLASCVQTGSGAHPVFYPMGTGGPIPGDKARPGRDADHTPPSGAEVMNE